MSKHKYGLLLSQLLDCLSKPLEEEHVWALCHKICQSLLRRRDEWFSGSVIIAVETIYVMKDGEVAFIPGRSDLLEDNVTHCQANDLSKVLLICLENGSPNKQLKRHVAGELESLLWNLAFGEFTDGNLHWLNMVVDCCERHVANCLMTSHYHSELLKSLVQKAMDMHNFLGVVMNEITQAESQHTACSAFELLQSRPIVGNWLQCMAEIREENPQKRRMKKRSTSWLKTPLPFPLSSSLLSTSSHHTTDEQQGTTGNTLDLSKPLHQSTPTAVCYKTRKVLRPPQRLVNQVTTWMLEGNIDEPSICTDDGSWLPRQQGTSSLGWLRETKRIRHVLTELQIDTAMDDSRVYNALRHGDICFCCRATKFSVFGRSQFHCDVCERKVCSSCIRNISSRDLRMSSHDSGISSRDWGNRSCDESRLDDSSIFGQLYKVFKSKNAENYNGICKDCTEFIQQYS